MNFFVSFWWPNSPVNSSVDKTFFWLVFVFIYGFFSFFTMEVKEIMPWEGELVVLDSTKQLKVLGKNLKVET